LAVNPLILLVQKVSRATVFVSPRRFPAPKSVTTTAQDHCGDAGTGRRPRLLL